MNVYVYSTENHYQRGAVTLPSFHVRSAEAIHVMIHLPVQESSLNILSNSR